MKKILLAFLATLQLSWAYSSVYYGPALCTYPQYDCLKVTRGDSWESLFPDPQHRDLVQRLNRSYNALWPGKEIAVPINLTNLNLFDISPFPLKVEIEGEKHIIVDQKKLAWSAYNEQGHLVKWGPISSGRDKCVDSPKSCRTLTGMFRIFSKENEQCRSNTYDNARMPYCMYFHKGFALHGSNDIPGYRASHGCVRLFTEDAKWLNHEFVELSSENNDFKGTKVIIK